MSSPPRGAVATRVILRKIDGRSSGHLLRDHPAKRKPQNVASLQTKSVQEGLRGPAEDLVCTDRFEPGSGNWQNRARGD
jgi:hypothetical protein